jgi:hypothetical protein
MDLDRLVRSVAIFAVLLFSPLAVHAASQRDIIFKNTTGQQVDDLHLSFATPTRVTDKDGFAGFDMPGLTTVDFFGSAGIANNGSVTVKFANDQPTVHINTWWWTSGGTAGNRGAQVGPMKRDTGGRELSFFGGAASGTGSLLININAVDHIFTTTLGSSPQASALAFEGFLEGLIDNGFALIHSALVDDTTVDFFGNLLGDPNTELSAQLLSSDTTQGVDLRDAPLNVPEASMALLLGAGLVGLSALRLVRRGRSASGSRRPS